MENSRTIIYLLFTIIFLSCYLHFFQAFKVTLTLRDFEKFIEDFFKYLDKFYVVNIWLTTFNVFIYLALHVLIVIFTRNYLFKDFIQYNENIYLDEYYIFVITITKMILILIIIILLNILLKLIFNTSLFKLHIYLEKKKYYAKLLHIAHTDYLVEIFGKIYLFLDNIINERTLRNLADNYDYKQIFYYEEIYESLYIQKLSNKLITLSKKFISIFLIVIILRNIFKWLYTHITFDCFIPFIPRILFIWAIIYNFIYLNGYYAGRIFCCYYLIMLIMDYFKFIEHKSPLTDHYLNKYFYNLNYKNARKYLNTDFPHFITLITQDENNNAILREIKKLYLVKYILNDFKRTSPETQRFNNLLNSLYKRFTMLMLYSIVIYYFSTNFHYYVIFSKSDLAIPLITIFIFIFFVLFFLSKKTRKSIDPVQEDFDCRVPTCENIKAYNILFWTLTIISFSIIYILYTIPKIGIIDVLYDSTYIKIIRELTIEEKYIYYDKYLEAVLDKLKDLENIGNHIENMRYFIEELKWKDFITKETTIVEIREIIDTFINSYFKHLKNHYLQNMEKKFINKIHYGLYFKYY